MADIYSKRMTGEVQGDFLLFLIGMRFNRLWKIQRKTAMGRMGLIDGNDAPVDVAGEYRGL